MPGEPSMKILVVGGGGREHALAWKLAADSRRPRIFCAPGNAGTAQTAVNLPIAATDIEGLLEWARTERPDLTVVGPEAPLCAGIADRFESEGLRVFGPRADGARLEGSKVFAKEIMLAAGVPTAPARWFSDHAAAGEYLQAHGAPVVIKADGLAAGKGVFVCTTEEEAQDALKKIMLEKEFGPAGERVLIEDLLDGEEVSMLALVDGDKALLLASSQDHKRIYDGDRGPNTGGMGAYSPAPVADEEMRARVEREIFGRLLAELKRRDIRYQGILYAGLMITGRGPHVLEFNCRFGDPETQAILPRWEGDMLPALEACLRGELRQELVAWRPDACVCVVMASQGYPGRYAKGRPIKGLDQAAALPGVTVFHAGTTLAENDEVVTSGGRVLGVTALGKDLPEAVERAYAAVDAIDFEGAQYRRDIAARALGRKT